MERYELRNHLDVSIVDVSIVDERVLSFEKCEVTCTGSTKFMKHKQYDRQIRCTNCGKKIPYNSKTNHMRQCIREKEIKCEYCPALFNRIAVTLVTYIWLLSSMLHYYIGCIRVFSPSCFLMCPQITRLKLYIVTLAAFV